jgi:deoxyribonuclease-2
LEGPWCFAGFQVTNVKQVTLTPTIKWTEAEDHSKWALLEQKYSCFGDMNRMTSQWKRGGAFYCLEDLSLHAALKKLISVTDECPINSNNESGGK